MYKRQKSTSELRAILEASVAENEADGVVMTKAMLRRRVVSLYRAGDYRLALEVARLANASSTPNSDSHGEACTASTEGSDLHPNTPDPVLTEVIALLEEKLALDEENDASSSDDDEDEDDDDDSDEDEDDDDDEDHDEDDGSEKEEET